MTGGSVMLVDRDQLFSAALAALLEDEGLEVEAPLPSVTAVSAVLDDGLEPALIITDPSGLDRDGEASPLSRLREIAPDARLLVLSADMSANAVAGSMNVGAHGHVSKGASFNVVLRAVKLIQQGQAVYPANVAQNLGQGVAAPESIRDGEAAELSPRETQILACILSGHSNKAIARRLAITESTVKMHFKNAMRKINASNRTQAAIWAMEHGIAPMA